MATENMRVDEALQKEAQQLAKSLSEKTGANVPATEVTKAFAELIKRTNGGKGIQILPVVVITAPQPPRPGRPPFNLKL